VRNRIFLKLVAAFVVVIAAATVTLDISIRRAWEDSLRQGMWYPRKAKPRARGPQLSTLKVESWLIPKPLRMQWRTKCINPSLPPP
jgi:hypothetical protein